MPPAEFDALKDYATKLALHAASSFVAQATMHQQAAGKEVKNFCNIKPALSGVFYVLKYQRP